jgi:hypothetical protein
MSLFSKKKDVAVQSFILKVVNNNCPELKALIEGPRLDSRVNIVLVVMIIPVVDKKLQTKRVFTAVTKELSNTGVGIVLDRPMDLDEAVIGFRFEGEMTFFRAQAKHLEPMGGGFFQLGFHLREIISPGDQPELDAFGF